MVNCSGFWDNDFSSQVLRGGKCSTVSVSSFLSMLFSGGEGVKSGVSGINVVNLFKGKERGVDFSILHCTPLVIYLSYSWAIVDAPLF